MDHDPNQPPSSPYGQQPPPLSQRPSSQYEQPQQPSLYEPQPQWGQQPLPQYRQPPDRQPQYGGSPIPTYWPPQPPKKRSSRWLWITLALVGGLIALGCVGVFAAIFLVVYNSPAVDITNHYYTAIKNQDYATAYSFLDASRITLNGQQLTQDAYIQAGRALDAQKGKITTYSLPSVEISDSGGVNTAGIMVSVTREGVPYAVHLQLQQEDSGWKIVGIDGI